ncbi:MAG TPA: hypothetical protein VES67_20540 [Vicinamibacterales bacterium]|nr:hypothetical protein [Vicinamibacterales bacterium]
MRTLKVALTAVVFAIIATPLAQTSEQTWTGKISDKMCGVSHVGMGENVTDRECTLKCVKGGSPYVFVVDKKVLAVANQKFEGLETHAGHTVLLTGQLKDSTITVSKIAMPKGQ